MKLPKELNEIVKKIDWLETVKLVMPIVQPFVQGGIWYAFTNFDKRAQALSRFIAIAEVIPAVDLNLPKGVVLASMYDGVEDALKIWSELVDAIGEIPQAVKDLVKTVKEEIEEKIPTKEDILEPVEPILEASHEFQTALADCVANAKDNLKYGTYYTPAGPLWIVSCMTQKGFNISLKYVKDKLF